MFVVFACAHLFLPHAQGEADVGHEEGRGATRAPGRVAAFPSAEKDGLSPISYSRRCSWDRSPACVPHHRRHQGNSLGAIKSNNVEEHEQGRIQGAHSLSLLASAVGPASMRLAHSFTKDAPYHGPGSMFAFAGALYLPASFFACALPSDKANSRRRGGAAPRSPRKRGDDDGRGGRGSRRAQGGQWWR